MQGNFIWEEGDGAEEDYVVNLPKKLNALPCGGIQHGTVLEIDDNSQNLTIQVAVSHQDVWEGDEVPDFPFTVGKVPPKKEEPKALAAATKESGEAVVEDVDEVVLLDDDEVAAELGDKKRPADSLDGEKPSKKQKTDAADAVEVVEIE